MERKINDAGINLIKRWEGCVLKAYQDASPKKNWTIGYGHTGPDVVPGRVITQAEAETLLRIDLTKHERDVSRIAKGLVITDNQFAALVSLCYNIGPWNLEPSTVMKKLRAGDVHGSADAFRLFKYAAKKVLPGLVARREAERELFLKLA